MKKKPGPKKPIRLDNIAPINFLTQEIGLVGLMNVASARRVNLATGKTVAEISLPKRKRDIWDACSCGHPRHRHARSNKCDARNCQCRRFRTARAKVQAEIIGRL